MKLAHEPNKVAVWPQGLALKSFWLALLANCLARAAIYLAGKVLKVASGSNKLAALAERLARYAFIYSAKECSLFRKPESLAGQSLCLSCLVGRLGGLGFGLGAAIKPNRHRLPQGFQARTLAGDFQGGVSIQAKTINIAAQRHIGIFASAH